MRLCIVILFLFECCLSSLAQSGDTSSLQSTTNTISAVENISTRSLSHINNKYSKLTHNIEKHSKKLLERLQRKEKKLQGKLESADSLKAAELFEGTAAKYKELENKIKLPVEKLNANRLQEYIPGLDSLQTSLKFLWQDNLVMDPQKLAAITSASEQLQELQGRLQQANNIQSLIREREAQLRSALQNSAFGKELLGINKEVYYYQQRLREYKDLINDRKKLEEKLLATVRELPAFQKFFQKYSFLAQLFPARGNATTEALAGLQTRVNVQNIMTQRISAGGTGGVNPQQYLQQQMQAAQSQLNAIKDKINRYGGGSSDMTMPDFKPNSQKTKSFLKRLEYGFNVQGQRGTSFLPVTWDLGLHMGYKISDNKTAGIGLSYKLGVGNGIRDLHFTHQGIGMRSYVDIKAKGSLWITGGMEYNYLSEFKKFEEIKNLDVWQQSALMGITKKYKIGKKQSKMQLLYDFLADKQVPKGQALKFRIGWSF
jgi:hypothetical protein